MSISLRGSLRQSLKLTGLHWRRLAQASLLPFLLSAVIAALQLWQMREIYLAGLAANLAPSAAADANLEALVQGHAWLFIGYFIFNGIITAWQFTRVVQYWKSGTAKAFAIQPSELHDTSAVVVYALFVGILLFVAYAFGVVLIVVAGQGLAILGLPEAGLAQLIIPASVALLIGMVALAMRFFAAFPGIAQGGTPRPMRDLLPLSQGLGGALTWRAILSIVGFGVVSILLMLAVTLSLVAFLGANIIDPQTNQLGPMAEPQLLKLLMPALIVSVWLRAIFVAQFSTFLTLVFARLSGQAEALK